MRMTFVQPAPFVKVWRRLALTDEDLQALEAQIMEQPQAGAVMRGTGGMRKTRFAPPSWNRGKSGATRVCYVCFTKAAACYLLAIYPKNEKENLSDRERADYRNFIERIRDSIEDK